MTNKPETINSRDLVYKNDALTYKRNTDTPFTGIEEFYENGQLKFRWSYIDGKREGLQEIYYEGGPLKYRSNIKNGKREGLQETFYEIGQLYRRANFKKGNEHGLCEYFDEDGNLTKAQTYEEGELKNPNLQRGDNTKDPVQIPLFEPKLTKRVN